MSEVGHYRTFRDAQATSAITPTADIARAFMSTRPGAVFGFEVPKDVRGYNDRNLNPPH